MDTMAVKILRMMADLRTVIEERRKELNVTKQMLEENTGYGRHPYSNFIEGDSDISLSNFLRVCEYLHIYIGVEVNRNIKPFEKRPKGKLSHKNYQPKPKKRPDGDGGPEQNNTE